MRKSLYLYRTLTNTVTSCEKYFHKDMLSLANGRRKIESMKKFRVKQKLNAFMAAALCVCMAASPLTAFAESLPEQEESLWKEDVF